MSRRCGGPGRKARPAVSPLEHRAEQQPQTKSELSSGRRVQVDGNLGNVGVVRTFNVMNQRPQGVGPSTDFLIQINQAPAGWFYDATG